MAAAVSTSAHSNKSTIVRANKLASVSRSVGFRATRAGLRVLTPHAPTLAAMWAEKLFMTARRRERPSWERDALAQAEAGRVDYEGSYLPIWTWSPTNVAANSNDASSGETPPTILLVHGWEGRGSQLATFVPQLLARGFRVITFDAPGHGDSPLARGSVVEHSRAVLAMAEHIGSSLHAVIGHSVGGAAALLATRFGLAAKRFVLVSPPRSPAKWALGFAKMMRLEPAVQEQMITRLEERSKLPMRAIDSQVDASRLEKPVLVIHDRDDKIVPFDEGAVIARSAPHGELFETQGFGHNAILRAPRVVDAVIRFASEGVDPSSSTPSFEETINGELFMRDTRW